MTGLVISIKKGLSIGALFLSETRLNLRTGGDQEVFPPIHKNRDAEFVYDVGVGTG
jgi:hypothetical protein